MQKGTKRLTQQRSCTKYKNNNKISAPDQYCPLRSRFSTVFPCPVRGTQTSEMVLVTEIDTRSSVLTKTRMFTFILVNTVCCTQSPGTRGTTKNRNKTKK